MAAKIVFVFREDTYPYHSSVKNEHVKVGWRGALVLVAQVNGAEVRLT